jgi:hypothetical protein
MSTNINQSYSLPSVVLANQNSQYPLSRSFSPALPQSVTSRFPHNERSRFFLPTKGRRDGGRFFSSATAKMEGQWRQEVSEDVRKQMITEMCVQTRFSASPAAPEKPQKAPENAVSHGAIFLSWWYTGTTNCCASPARMTSRRSGGRPPSLSSCSGPTAATGYGLLSLFPLLLWAHVQLMRVGRWSRTRT